MHIHIYIYLFYIDLTFHCWDTFSFYGQFVFSKFILFYICLPFVVAVAASLRAIHFPQTAFRVHFAFVDVFTGRSFSHLHIYFTHLRRYDAAISCGIVDISTFHFHLHLRYYRPFVVFSLYLSLLNSAPPSVFAGIARPINHLRTT